MRGVTVLLVSYTDSDFDQLLRALQRYADESMDQWDYLRLPGRHGPIFVSIRREPESGYAADAYRELDPNRR